MNDLKIEIDSYASRLLGTARLCKLAVRGAVTPSVVATYLYNLFYLIGFTELHLVLAKERASELGRIRLSSVFGGKIPEERGHDAWAASDLSAMREQFGVEANLELKPAMARLVQHIEASIRLNPASYLGYMTFAEYLTVIAGPSWIGLLSERCGVPSSSLSVVSRHVELDREHAARGFAELGELIDIGDIHAVFETVRGAMQCLEAFYDELADDVEKTPESEGLTHAA